MDLINKIRVNEIRCLLGSCCMNEQDGSDNVSNKVCLLSPGVGSVHRFLKVIVCEVVAVSLTVYGWVLPVTST